MPAQFYSIVSFYFIFLRWYFQVLPLFSGFSSSVVHGTLPTFVLVICGLPFVVWFFPVPSFHKFEFQKWPTVYQWHHRQLSHRNGDLKLAYRAHSPVSSGDQESFGVDTAKRVLGEFASSTRIRFDPYTGIFVDSSPPENRPYREFRLDISNSSILQ